MKKIITLLLLIGGFACAANAAKLYVCLSHTTKYWPDANAKIYAHLWGATGVDVLMDKEVLFGNIWYSCELNGNTNAALCRMNPDFPGGDLFQNGGQYIWNQTYDINLSTSVDKYIKIYQIGTNDRLNWEEVSNPNDWNRIVLRGNIKDTWSSETTNTIREADGYTFTYTLAKSDIEAYSNYDTEGIRFRFAQLGDVCFNFETNKTSDNVLIYPNGDGIRVSLPGSASPAFVNTGWNTSYYWQVDIPSYDYEKIVISAKYVETTAPAGNWQVSADAYIPVTTNGSGYCTLTVAAPLTISGATAYYATDNNNGSATAHSMTNPEANTPMLIKGDPSTTYSFAVAASGTDSPSDNAFKAGTGSALASTTDGKYNYILNGDAFFAANDKTVALGKAYLQLSTAASARALVFADDGATGIEAVDNMPFANDHSVYNLNGQRVNTPQKGLYIVNGRKVVLK